MAASLVVSQQSNGLRTDESQLRAISELEKILKLRDDVFAGNHPRLHISSKDTRRVDHDTSQTPSSIKPKLTNGATVTSRSAHISDSTYYSPALSSQLSSSFPVPVSRARQNNVPPATPTSGLDPIFLTKSEDLIRAEIRLQRQRIERSLEEQVQQRNKGIRQRVSDLEALPEFDVSEVLVQAQQLVKPVAASNSNGANGIASSSDSVDDNTFYSSQMNDTASDDAEEHSRSRKTKPCKYFFEGTCRKGEACKNSHDPAFKQQLLSKAPRTAHLAPNTPQDLHPAQELKAHDGKFVRHRNRRSSVDIERTFEGRNLVSDSAAEQTLARSRAKPLHHGTVAGESQDDQFYLSDEMQKSRSNYAARHNYNSDNHVESTRVQDEYASPNGRFQPGSPSMRNGRSSPAARDIRVVRNHITSPIAPQPARVSPLAVAKLPRLDQIRRGEQEVSSPRNSRQHGYAQQSPLATPQPANPRKRRREIEFDDGARNVAARRDLASPLPYIKDEPVSPPPFSGHSSQQPLHHPARRESIILDSTPPHLKDRVIYRQRPVEPQYFEPSEYRRVSTPVVRRVISRAGHHYEVQEEPDSRRIVSATHPRRLVSPQQDLGHYSAPQPRAVRAASHSYITHPDTARPGMYRASVQPQAVSYSRPGPRPDRSLSPELRQVRYSPVQHEPLPMAPPPRRIVIDQHGHKYYEAPVPVERRSSVAPSSRYVNDPVNPFEQPSSRRASVQPQVVRHHHNEGTFVSSVQTPGPTSPRYVEYYPAPEPVHDVSHQRLYEPREEVYRDRDNLVRVLEYPQDKPLRRYEDLQGVGDSIVRVRSVRPSGAHYGMPREHVSRMQTVQPEQERIIELGSRRDPRGSVVRQIGARGDERYEKAPTYVTVDSPRYQYLSGSQPTDHVNGDAQGEILMESARNDGRRPFQRL
ncbi:hypothetical protein MMC13_006742 [Lambiella insularis]|nr:hypothetical protein [Lambiella insularis]